MKALVFLVEIRRIVCVDAVGCRRPFMQRGGEAPVPSYRARQHRGLTAAW